MIAFINQNADQRFVFFLLTQLTVIAIGVEVELFMRWIAGFFNVRTLFIAGTVCYSFHANYLLFTVPNVIAL